MIADRLNMRSVDLPPGALSRLAPEIAHDSYASCEAPTCSPSVRTAAFSPDETQLATGDALGTVLIWPLAGTGAA